MSNSVFANPNFKEYTLAQSPNCSYLIYVRGNTVVNTPMEGSTMGLMMLLATLQWQAPLAGPTYSNAASQAGRAAFIVSGAQGAQDKVSNIVTKNVTNAIHSMGITDNQAGIVLGAAKVVHDRGFAVHGPHILGANTNLTMNQNSGSLGLGWSFR